jgi:hypothetical protein
MLLKILDRQGISKMDAITRFNGEFTIQAKETLPAHSYWVTYYANIIFRELFFDKMDKNLFYYEHYRLTHWTIGHDSDEVATGDVIFPTKYDKLHGKEIREKLDAIKRHYVCEMEDSAIKREFKVVEEIEGSQKISTPLLKHVLKLADWLSLLKYIYREIEMGNKALYYVVGYAKEHIAMHCREIESNAKYIDYFYNHQILTDICTQIKTL